MQKKSKKAELKISKIGITEDKISGRGGLAFFLRYIVNFYINYLSGDS